MWLVGDTLLFKGEAKNSDEDMREAMLQLAVKLKDWSANYHGTVREIARDHRSVTACAELVHLLWSYQVAC